PRWPRLRRAAAWASGRGAPSRGSARRAGWSAANRRRRRSLWTGRRPAPLSGGRGSATRTRRRQGRARATERGHGPRSIVPPVPCPPVDTSLFSVWAPEDLGERLERERVTFYHGIDAMAESLHVGQLVGIMAIRRLQQAGHRPILVV